MAKFAYRCSDATGQVHSGEVEAESRRAAVERLMKKGLTVLAVTAVEPTSASEQRSASVPVVVSSPTPQATEWRPESAFRSRLLFGVAALFVILGSLVALVGLSEGLMAVTRSSTTWKPAGGEFDTFRAGVWSVVFGVILATLVAWLERVDKRLRDIQIALTKR